MKRKKLFLLFASFCLILVLAVSPFMAACAKPAPGVVDVAALQKEIAALENKVAACEKDKAASEKEVAALKKEIAKLEAATPAKPHYEWILHGSFPWGDVSQAANKDFVEKVFELSNGRIKITNYAEGEIVAPDEVLHAVGKGVVELGHGSGSYHAGETPVLTADFGIPFSYVGGPETLWRLATQSDWYAVLEEVYNEEYGVHYLGPNAVGELPAMFGNVPIKTIADFKGVKIRTTGMSAGAFEALGASTVWMPGAEIYMALKLGTVDAATWDPAAVRSLKWGEVIKYVYKPAWLSQAFNNKWVNLDLWNSLSEEDKDILNKAQEEQYFLTAAQYAEETEWAVTIGVEEYGYEICELLPGEYEKMRDKAMSVLEEWGTTDESCARILEVIKKEWMAVPREAP